MPQETALPITICHRFWDKVSWESIIIDGKDCYMKRNVEPSEFRVNLNNHRVLSFTNSANAIRNEKLAIDYVRANTKIPVPNIVYYLDEGSRVYLATEKVEGICFDEVGDPHDKQKVIEQLDAYVEELETHRSSKIRGFGVDVCFPAYINDLEDPVGSEEFLELDSKPFVLCHGDLHPGNIIVDPKTMKIEAVIDWEYAGYYPAVIDPRRYKYSHKIVHLADGSLMPRMKHADMAKELIKRYRESYKQERVDREGVIEIVDGEPVYKSPSFAIELPDLNTVLLNSHFTTFKATILREGSTSASA